MKRVRHSLQTLRVFLLVAESGSVSRAAEQSSLTQSAVTKHVRALEDMLGTALFARSGQGMALLPAARAYHRGVRRALQLLDDSARRLAADRPRHDVAQVRLGPVPAVAQRWLIGRLQEFEALHPDIRVQLVPRLPDAQGRTAAAYAEIRAGTGKFPGWRARYLLGCQLCFAVAPAVHRTLVAAGIDVGRVTQALVDALPLLSHVLHPHGWDETLEALGLSAVHAERIRCELYSVLIPSAVAGRGLALVPPFLIAQEIAAGQLVRIGGLASGRTGFHLLVPRAPAPTPALERLVDWLEQQARATENAVP